MNRDRRLRLYKNSWKEHQNKIEYTNQVVNVHRGENEVKEGVRKVDDCLERRKRRVMQKAYPLLDYSRLMKYWRELHEPYNLY